MSILIVDQSVLSRHLLSKVVLALPPEQLLKTDLTVFYFHSKLYFCTQKDQTINRVKL